MGKLTWKSLGLIYEGNFNVSPEEAAQFISDGLFHKGWVGEKGKPGRMWEDQEHCRALCELLLEIDIRGKKDKTKFKTTLRKMFKEKDTAIAIFQTECRIAITNFDTFYNKMMFWQQLPFVKQRPKKLSPSYKKRKEAADRKLKRALKLQSDAKKQLLLRKK